MLTCPFCENALKVRSETGWQCDCGEHIPLGLENDSEENCGKCQVLYCPRRKRPVPAATGNTQ